MAHIYTHGDPPALPPSRPPFLVYLDSGCTQIGGGGGCGSGGGICGFGLLLGAALAATLPMSRRTSMVEAAGGRWRGGSGGGGRGGRRRGGSIVPLLGVVVGGRSGNVSYVQNYF